MNGWGPLAQILTKNFQLEDILIPYVANFLLLLFVPCPDYLVNKITK